MSSHAQERIPTFGAGDRLRKAREKTGLDQTQFAEEIGVSRGTVSNYEAKQTPEGMKKPYLQMWALRCDVPVEWLRDGVNPEAPSPDPGDGTEQPDALKRLTATKKGRTRRSDTTERYVPPARELAA